MLVNETLNVIMSRRSVRAYKPDPLPQNALASIIEAGGAAPYVVPKSRYCAVIQDRSQIARLSEAAKAQGMKVGDSHRELFSAPGFDGTYGAPVVIIVAGNEKTPQYEAACGACVQNMLLAAKSQGIASCWVYFPIFAFHGPQAGSWRKELRIPDGYKPCAAILLGYEKSAGAPDSSNR